MHSEKWISLIRANLLRMNFHFKYDKLAEMPNCGTAKVISQELLHAGRMCALMRNASCSLAKYVTLGIQLCQFHSHRSFYSSVLLLLQSSYLHGCIRIQKQLSSFFFTNISATAMPLPKWFVFLRQSKCTERGQKLECSTKRKQSWKKSHFVSILTFMFNKCRLCSDALSLSLSRSRTRFISSWKCCRMSNSLGELNAK